MEYLLKIIESSDDLKPLVNAQNESGNTPLHWAALNGHLETVKLLCNSEADPLLKNQAGHDSYYEAQSNDQEDIVDYLLEHYDVTPEDDDEDEETQQEEQTEQNQSKKTAPNGN